MPAAPIPDITRPSRKIVREGESPVTKAPMLMIMVEQNMQYLGGKMWHNLPLIGPTLEAAT